MPYAQMACTNTHELDARMNVMIYGTSLPSSRTGQCAMKHLSFTSPPNSRTQRYRAMRSECDEMLEHVTAKRDNTQ